MHQKTINRLLLGFNLLYLLPFSLYYISIRNFEFIWYIFIIIAFIFGIIWLHLRIHFTNKILWGLSLWGFFHMAGGGIIIKGTKLYEAKLLPIWITDDFYILKFDQFVHFYFYFIMVFIIYEVIKTYSQTRMNNFVLYALITLSSIGLGAMNELAEFIAVLAFEDTGVGNYYNNAWDNVFNTTGAIMGLIALHLKNMTQGENIS